MPNELIFVKLKREELRRRTHLKKDDNSDESEDKKSKSKKFRKFRKFLFFIYN